MFYAEKTYRIMLFYYKMNNNTSGLIMLSIVLGLSTYSVSNVPGV